MGGCPYYVPSTPVVPKMQWAVPLPEVQVESAAVEYDTPSLRRLRNFVKVKKVSMWETFRNYFSASSSRPFNDTMEFRPSDANSPVWPFQFDCTNMPY